MLAKKSAKDLRDEREKLGSDLESVAAQIAAADAKIAESALPAMRGDKQAETSLCSVEESKIAAQTHQCRLKAAKTAVESELADAIAAEQSEAERIRICAMADRAQRLRERADELDVAARVLVATYGKFRK